MAKFYKDVSEGRRLYVILRMWETKRQMSWSPLQRHRYISRKKSKSLQTKLKIEKETCIYSIECGHDWGLSSRPVTFWLWLWCALPIQEGEGHDLAGFLHTSQMNRHPPSATNPRLFWTANTHVPNIHVDMMDCVCLQCIFGSLSRKDSRIGSIFLWVSMCGHLYFLRGQLVL